MSARLPGPARAAARRRRQARLARTVVVALVLVVVLVVVIFAGGSGKHGPAVRTSPPRSTPGASAPPPSSTVAAPPSTVAVAAAASLPAARSRPAIATDGGTLLILGGLIGGTPGTSTSSVLRFDPSAGTATPAGTLAVATHDAAAAATAAGILVFGGGAATTIDTVQAYSPQGTRVVGRLPRPRSDVVAIAIAGHAYVLGGFDGSVIQRDVLRTDDGTTFTVVARLPVPVRYPAIVAQGTTIYLLGGETDAGAVDDIQAVDVASGSSRIIGHLPTPLSDATAFVLRGSVFLAGGLVHGSPVASVVRVDVGSGAVTPAGTLPSPVADAGVGTIGDTAYLVGGEGPRRLSEILAVTAG